MRGVSWLGRTVRVSTAVSPLAFRDTRSAPASRAPRGYLGMGNNTPVSDVTSVAAVRAASPDTVILIDEAYHEYVTDPSYKTAMDIAKATPTFAAATNTWLGALGAVVRIGMAAGCRCSALAA